MARRAVEARPHVFDIVVRATLGGVLIGIVLLLAKAGRTQAAGLLVLFPAVTLVSFYFVGSSEGSEELARVVKASLLASPVWFIFIGVMAITVGHVDYRVALGLATVAWLAVGGIYLALTR